MSTKRTDPKYERSYTRAILRSAFVSLFWAVITERRKKGAYTLLELAKKLGANKAEVSRWFKSDPNWTINTIASIASALDLDLTITATDRATGEVYTPAGKIHMQQSQPNTASGGSAMASIRFTRVEGLQPVKITGFSDAA
jgi:transcriptional regulator with XRE-family HTH domain